MKNITVFTVLVIILSVSVPAEAQEAGKYSFSAKPCLGMFLGQAEEIVYSTSTRYYNDMISQLLWDIKNIFYYGLDLNYSPIEPLEKRGLLFDLSIKYAIPAYGGTMEDRDWLSSVNNALTCYSSHDNYVDEILFLDLNAAYSFPFRSLFTLKPVVSLSYMHFVFSGMNGSGIYAKAINSISNPGHYYPIKESPDIKSFEGLGTVITYSQDWAILSTGVSFGIQFLKNFFFDVDFNISPLVLCIALDKHNHETRKEFFKDYVLGGFYFEPRATLSYYLNHLINFSLGFSYRSINGPRGASYARHESDPYFTATNEAGTGLSLMELSLKINIRFQERSRPIPMINYTKN